MFKIDYTPHYRVEEILPDDYNVLNKKANKEVDACEYIDSNISYDTETSSWRVYNVPAEVSGHAIGEVITQTDIEQMTQDERDEMHACSEPRACTYAWMIAIDGKCLLMRSWGEFLAACDAIHKHYKTTPNRRVVIWAHNLPYEFQFMRKRLNFLEVFSLKDRSVVRCLTDKGLEFRDSLPLAKMSLADVADRLRTYKINKMTGDLDYRLIRHTDTKLTTEEIGYCLHDGLILNCWSAEKCEEDGGLLHVPVTDTSYVRRDTRKMCQTLPKGHGRKYIRKKDGKEVESNFNLDYYKMIQSLKLDTADYLLNKDAFAGGISHANINHVGKVLHGVGSYDFTSDYPGRQVSCKYPMSPWYKHDDIKDEYDVMGYVNAGYCVIFRCVISNIREKVTWEHVLSESKCMFVPEATKTVDNGRIVRASSLSVALTDVDLEYLSWFYTWDSLQVYEAKIAYAGYLPAEFIKAILHFYKLKCELKGVPGRELDLQKAKGELNSEYGMLVMDIIRQWISYDDDTDCWEFVENAEKTTEMMDDELLVHNSDRQRFTYYSWGVYCTAWARYWLCDMIRRFVPYKHKKSDPNGAGWYSDYVYADTDSIKIMHPERYARMIAKRNARIREAVEKCLKSRGIDVADSRPKGKYIGEWAFEGVYSEFKTLGAKRYLVRENVSQKALKDHWSGNCEIPGLRWELGKGYCAYEATVAGCNKKRFSRWLSQQENPFDTFEFGLVVKNEVCGRMICQYLDTKKAGTVTDYCGVTIDYVEESAVYMEPADYCMSQAKEFRALRQALNLI